MIPGPFSGPLSGPLLRSRPDAVGLDREGIAAFVAGGDALDVHSLMVLRKGRVAAECWWAPYSAERTHWLYSLSKSFTSAAVGLLVAESKASLDERVVDVFPDGTPNEISPNLAAMTVRHLMNMTTGHENDPLNALATKPVGDWEAAFLAHPVPREPGTHWIYNTAATYMLSALVTARTGERLLDYLTPRLFAPLGIEGAAWERDPKGIDVGGWGLSLKTEDLAKFGEVLRRNGADLLPAEWVREATRKQTDNRGDTPDWSAGYGYQFWMCAPPSSAGDHGHVYRGDGAFGQLLVIVPERELVVAVTAGTGDIPAVLNLVWEHILPALQEPQGEPGGEPYRDETLKIRAVGRGEPTREPLTLDLDNNDMDWRKIALLPDPVGTRLEIEDEDGLHTIPVGAEDWAEGRAAFGLREPTDVLARGGWTAPERFETTLCYVDTPFHPTLKIERGEVVLTGPLRFGPAERKAYAQLG